MKCPFRKKIVISPDGLSRVTETFWKDCLYMDCPFYGGVEFTYDLNTGVRKVSRMGCKAVKMQKNEKD